MGLAKWTTVLVLVLVVTGCVATGNVSAKQRREMYRVDHYPSAAIDAGAQGAEPPVEFLAADRVLEEAPLDGGVSKEARKRLQLPSDAPLTPDQRSAALLPENRQPTAASLRYPNGLIGLSFAASAAALFVAGLWIQEGLGPYGAQPCASKGGFSFECSSGSHIAVRGGTLVGFGVASAVVGLSLAVLAVAMIINRTNSGAQPASRLLRLLQPDLEQVPVRRNADDNQVDPQLADRATAVSASSRGLATLATF